MTLTISCANKWEYKTIQINANASIDANADVEELTFDAPENELNKLGEEGWELAGVYTNTQTVFPNFGDDKYVTGIRTNTRTSVITFVLKRESVR